MFRGMNRAGGRSQKNAPCSAAAAQTNKVTSAGCLGPQCPAHTSLQSLRASTSTNFARSVAAAAVASPAAFNIDSEYANPDRPMKVLIAGAGIGGLVLGVSLLKKGVDVQLFERDMTAIRGEGKYRGPIQIQSNALAALEAIDAEMAEEIMAAGCVTGDRINGLVDGVSGKWYVKFDTYKPAVDQGMPITRVVSRVALQRILAKYAVKYGGEDVIAADTKVLSYEEDQVNGKGRIWACLEGGARHWGDILIGADGIWSKTRTQLVGPGKPSYSNYTCYTGIADYVCADIDTVGYRVFLGNKQYFVSSDVGGGKMQWYAFHKEAADGKDPEGKSKARLMEIFGHWNHMVTDLVAATPEDDVLRRDIYDRPPVFKWAQGRVALLGDSAHAMQPNLGQGGCMAIEDAYELTSLITERLAANEGKPLDCNFEDMLKTYYNKRIFRTSVIHGMAGMAAFAASTYKAFLGEGLGPLEAMTKLQIHHPGRVAGKVAMGLTMPSVLGWVLGGNLSNLKVTDRPQYCRLSDKPQGFDAKDFPMFMADDEALLRAARADWVLAPMLQDGDLSRACAEKAIALEANTTIGSHTSSDLHMEEISNSHARIEVEDGTYYLVDDAESTGTWLNGRRMSSDTRAQLHPGDKLAFGHHSPDLKFEVKMMHSSQRDAGLVSSRRDGSEYRLPVSFRDSRLATV